MSKPAWLPSFLRGLVYAVAAVPVYVLSFGPAMVLHNRIPSYPLRSAIGFCYQNPLALLCDHTPLGPVVGAYENWWTNLAPEIDKPAPKVGHAPPHPAP